jgi:hypothetical protein
MRTKHLIPIAAFALALTFSLQPSALVSASPLGTAFNYQGKLAEGANPANGSYDLKFTLYDAETGPSIVAGPLTNAAVAVSNGLFNVMVDFGNAFDGSARWLELGVRSNGSPADFTLLSPRQPINATPYASYAPIAAEADMAKAVRDGVITQEKIATGAVQPGHLASGAVDSSKIADGTITTADLSPMVLSNTFWRLSGNAGTIPGTQFLGTTDNQPLEVKVNGVRALRLEPNASGAPNVIGGAPANSVASGAVGAVIGGGNNNLIQTNANDSAIGGGNGNIVQANANASTVAGGYLNAIQTSAYASAIGGGSQNTIQSNAPQSTIGGGYLNTIQTNAPWSAIAGGSENTIQTGAAHSFIGGGYVNAIQSFAGSSAIGGGYNNIIQANAYLSSIGGGYRNTIQADDAAIVGGAGNTVQSGAHHSFIGGGSDNITAGSTATVSGGANNLAGALYSGIGSGHGNLVESTANASAISGGEWNVIQTNAPGAAIAGGIGNTVTANASLSFIGGGQNHRIESTQSSIGGGGGNLISSNGGFLTIAGGTANRIDHDNWSSTIGGGQQNQIFNNGGYSTIAGGLGNTIFNGTWCSTIAGGEDNTAQSGASQSMILGGQSNTVAGFAAFASGYRAKALHSGSFVWADTTEADFVSTGNNQFLIRAGGGVGIGTANPTAKLEVAGTVKATGFTGDGAGLTGIPATALADNSVTSAKIENGTITDADVSTSGISASKIIGGDLQATRLKVGHSHTLSGTYASIAGGMHNAASADGSFVGGGGYHTLFDWGNTASGGNSVVGGGAANEASGSFSVVPGGFDNVASNSYSFAAGRRAKALHEGSFVWGDSTAADVASTGNNQFIIRASGGVGIGTTNPVSALDVKGTVTVRGNLNVVSAYDGSTVVQLGEGLDYAEGFDVAELAKPAPGTVLVIDTEHTGKLGVSHEAYDRAVAGIVAGGQGLDSAVRAGVGRFDCDVALAGRVYCNVDGTFGGVSPGDLLTTSSTPGHAMVVKDFTRAQGAILGKAMQKLAPGEKGQILVLVTLQ